LDSYWNDGFYAFGLTTCPLCTRRQLSDADSVNTIDVDDLFWEAEATPVVYPEGAVASVNNVVEHGSYQDGFAVYAQFFKPMGITVKSDGSTLWIGDYGNNRIRNITCSSLTAPTFAPTALPTHVPTAKPTALPTAAPVAGKAKTGKGKGGVGAGKAAKGAAGAKGGAKAGKAGKHGVGESATAADASSTSASLSVTAVVLISVFSFVGAVTAAYLLYNRKSIANMLGSSN